MKSIAKLELFDALAEHSDEDRERLKVALREGRVCPDYFAIQNCGCVYGHLNELCPFQAQNDSVRCRHQPKHSFLTGLEKWLRRHAVKGRRLSEKGTQTLLKWVDEYEMPAVTFVRQSGHWYPLLDADTIDMRSAGFCSKVAVKAWAVDRASLTGERIKVKFI